VVDRPATTNRPDPTFAIGFTVDEPAARRALRAFISQRWFTPAGLKGRAFHRIEGVYLPTYLYSAVAESSYFAQIGEDYRTISTDGKKIRSVRRTETRPLEGRHTGYVADIIVTASATIDNDAIQTIEPFDLNELQRYSPAVVSGWISEEPALNRDRCLELARAECREAVTGFLRGFMPGDSHRLVRHQTSLSHETADLTLLPVWIAAIRHDDEAPPIRLLVNGQTGEVGGAIPVSWSKIGLLTAGAAALAVLLSLLVWIAT
jgi:hypothetical protein